ncbi:MAG: carboxypeptidase regulatory-like domain-containing protein [Planctomycetes bacterium]|nr:carboxypeptidase regulatory-like domain-containing protein [Planctomycetota bacterium]
MRHLKSTLTLACSMALLALVALPHRATGDEAGTAAVNGKIVFKGEKPKRARINMSGVQECNDMHGEEEPVYEESVVVNDNGTLKNVFVYVTKGLEGKAFTAPETPVVLDQKGCMYSPHVFGIMMGQKLEIKNSDPLMHNIHAMPTKNEGFNKSQPFVGGKSKTITQSFAEVEVPVLFKCEVHGWMGCYGCVVSNPFYAVSSDQGAFELKGLPAGTYELTAWHEQYGTQTASVTVGDKETKSVDFTFEAK